MSSSTHTHVLAFKFYVRNAWEHQGYSIANEKLIDGLPSTNQVLNTYVKLD